VFFSWLRMRLFDRVRFVVESFLPGRYRRLVASPWRVLLGQFFFTVVFSLVLMVLVALPLLFRLPSVLEQDFSRFDEFRVSLNVSMSEPLVVSRYPLVVVDLEKVNRTGERVLLNGDGVVYGWLFGEGRVSWDSLSSLSENASRYSGWLTLFVVLLLPSLLLALFVVVLVESLVIGVVSWLLLFVVLRVVRVHITPRALAKVCVVSLLPFVVVQVVPLVVVRWFVVPLVLFLVLCSLGAWFVGESRWERGVKEK